MRGGRADSPQHAADTHRGGQLQAGGQQGGVRQKVHCQVHAHTGKLAVQTNIGCDRHDDGS